MNKYLIKKIFLVFMISLFAINPFSAKADAKQKDLVIFAAASLKDALDEVSLNFLADEKISANTSYAASSALAKQIEQDAPADVFISANVKWVDYLDEKNLLKEKTRFNLLGNNIVLIANITSDLKKVDINEGFSLLELLNGGRLAMAETSSVPAGIYGKQALENLKIWDNVKNNLAQADSVRSALMLVSRGEAPLGIVYATDAASDKNVKVVGVFPDNSYEPVIYPAAIMANSTNKNAEKFLNYLKKSSTKKIFEKHGFNVLK